MYIPRHHAQPDTDALAALIASHALGAWVCQTAGGLVANHVPFHFDRQRGKLVGHVARANPVWRALGEGAGAGAPSVVMFQGPQAYITPGWYPSKREHGKAVPTWNYAVAHVHGRARAMDDPAWLRPMLEQLVNDHEASQASPWQVSDAPSDYIDRLLRAIVGIEIDVDRLEGKLKASQNGAAADRRGTVAGLHAAGGDERLAMAALVQAAIDAGTPPAGN